MPTISLSENNDITLNLSTFEDGKIAATIHSAEGRAQHNIQALLSIESVSNNGRGPQQPLSRSGQWWQAPEPTTQELRLCINHQPFALLKRSEHGWVVNGAPMRKLNCTEVRMLGGYPLPTDGSAPPYPCELPLEPQEYMTAITDLHTHQSGEVSADDLVQIAVDRGIGFPVKSLKEIGINTEGKPIVDVPFRLFAPEAHLYEDNKPEKVPGVLASNLNPQERKILTNAMRLPREHQSTYGNMERCYHMREPVTKEIRAFKDILWKIAEKYKAQGIQYAELSTLAVLEPGWLDVAHTLDPKTGRPLLDEIEHATGVTLRFLVGIPRNLPDKDIIARIDEIKKLKDSRFIAGVDWLGFENNKTNEIAPYISEFATWIHEHRPDWVNRVHAGENGKNRDNVLQTLQLAEKTKVRIRIGHGLYGMRKETLDYAQELARKFRANPTEGADIVFEVCPDSNLVNNHFEYPTESTVKELVDRDIPTVLSSDGGDLYSTDAWQTARTAKMAGLTYTDFRKIYDTERAYIQRQQTLDKQYFPDPVAYTPPALSRLPRPNTPKPTVEYKDLPDDGRMPLLIAGANGSAWDDLTPQQKQDNIDQLRALIIGGKLDTSRVYLAMGRLKQLDNGELVNGIEKEALKIANEYNALIQNANKMLPKDAQKKPLDCYMIVAEDRTPDKTPPAGITEKIHMRGALVWVADNLIPMIARRHGMLAAIGGLTYTRDMILLAHEHHVPMALSVNAPSASSEKARVYPYAKFANARELGQRIADWCPDGVTVADVEKFYAEKSREASMSGIGK